MSSLPLYSAKIKASTHMAIKIENMAGTKLPRRTEQVLAEIINTVPREHTRGLERLRLVDAIHDPRIPTPQRAKLPGLYHPRQGAQGAWIEVATGVFLSQSQPFFKRLMSRLSFKGNLAAVIFSLIGQHYYLTLRHSVRKGQLEASVRTYTEKYLKVWSENAHTFRSKLFKPLQPTLERWAKKLQKRAAEQNRASKGRG